MILLECRFKLILEYNKQYVMSLQQGRQWNILVFLCRTCWVLAEKVKTEMKLLILQKQFQASKISTSLPTKPTDHCCKMTTGQDRSYTYELKQWLYLAKLMYNSAEGLESISLNIC